MSLQEFITINTHYTRSINLERDAESLDVVHAYIPTSRALRTLQSISETFHNSQAPRAWSLIGPYGSGKSSFSVFLSQLLSNKDGQTALAAQEILKKTDAELSGQYTDHIADSNGYLKVLITGTPESISIRLVKGLAEAAKSHWLKRKGKKPGIISKLDKAVENEVLGTSQIIELVNELQNQLAKINSKGLLLIIDELGKFLEYEARHYGANDIYLLQALAEHACRGNQANLYLFVLLHQSFEQYAKGLGENLKTEWSKVQGRFEEVPFLESAEQVLRVVSAAFNHNLDAEKVNQIKVNTAKYISVLQEQNALPGALTHEEACKLFEGCYPLHPVSALLLPLLCQKVAQNERTLFNYLGSHEEHGLQDMLPKLESIKDYIYPYHIYDYFITNQPAVLGDYLTHRRWVEVVTAIERLGDARENEIHLLKTIGILNIIGSKGGFKSSKSILEICAPKKSVFTKSIKLLQEKSIVNYRRFNNEYRVWQGSDFDLEAALHEELNNLGNFSLAAELNKEKNLLPIVARKYTIQNGALRSLSAMESEREG
jgi:ABC-type iron transport system FetAB ATPase subunit